VSCPSCEQLTLTRPSRLGAEICGRCGEPLPARLSVVPLYRALQEEEAEPAVA